MIEGHMRENELSIFVGDSSPRSAATCSVPDLLPHLERVTEEIQFLYWDQQVWRAFDAVAAGSPVVRDSFFRAWVGELYYRRADIAVRAMRDGHADSHSLSNLLKAVRNRASDIPCRVPEMKADGTITVDPARVQSDLDAIEAACGNVKVYVNKVLAHADGTWKGFPPEAEVVDSAIDLLGALLAKYTLILRDVDGELAPLPVFNWTDVFRATWLPG